MTTADPGATQAQARAWFHALLPGPESRDRLAEAFAEGADPRGTMAVTQGWLVTGSTSLMEAVANASPVLGVSETLARLALMVRYTRPSETREEDKPVMRVLIKGVMEKWPVQALAPWQQLLDKPVVFSRLAFPVLHARVMAAEAESPDVLRWIHSALRPLQAWSVQDIHSVESLDDPLVRDAYWALRRTPSSRPGR